MTTHNEGKGFSFLTLLTWCEGHPHRALSILCVLFFLPGFFSLPPLDRDESRFAQATKQMLETGDFVEIRFQDEARNKKPVGIYWLQSVSAQVFSGPDHNRIWAYRLPSFIAGVLAIFLTFAIGKKLFDTRAGLIVAALLGTSTLLVVESTIAKTDATLLAVTLWAMWALGVHYLHASDPKGTKPKPLVTYSFWAALGVGLLIKGPVTLMVVGLTVLTLCIADRSMRWLKDLRPLSGVLLTAVIALPWFIAIYFATDGAFYAEALGKDLGGKIASGQESHGAPPGLYLAALWVTFWPGTLALLPTVPWAYREKATPQVRFLLAWALPCWLAMELIPTKLPHYTLPLYPALALLVAGMVVAALGAMKGKTKAPITQSLVGRIGLIFWLLPAVALAGLISWLPTEYGGTASLLTYVGSGLGVLLALCTGVLYWRGKLLISMAAASLTGLFIFWALIEGTLARLDAFHLSPNLQTALHELSIDDASQVGILGYSEPSFIFLNGTMTQLVSRSGGVAFLAEKPGRTLLVEVRKDGAFQEALRDAGLSVRALDEIKGFNYSKGDEVTLTLYQLVDQAAATTP